MIAHSKKPKNGVQDVQVHCLDSDLLRNAQPSPGDARRALRWRNNAVWFSS